MRARAVGLSVAFTTHDVRLRTHGTRDNSQVTFTSTDRTLTGDIHVGVKVVLDLQVVVVAVDSF